MEESVVSKVLYTIPKRIRYFNRVVGQLVGVVKKLVKSASTIRPALRLKKVKSPTSPSNVVPRPSFTRWTLSASFPNARKISAHVDHHSTVLSNSQSLGYQDRRAVLDADSIIEFNKAPNAQNSLGCRSPCMIAPFGSIWIHKFVRQLYKSHLQILQMRRSQFTEFRLSILIGPSISIVYSRRPVDGV